MSDANEIYQAVLEQCLKQIDGIKKEYGSQLSVLIAEQISKKYEDRLVRLENGNKKLKEEIRVLNSRINGAMANDYALPQDVSNNTQIKSSRVNIDELYDYFEFAGWIYYANEKMGNFLYRVKTDGTMNEKLTDYSVDSMLISQANVENGKIYFYDMNFNKRSISI